MRNASEAPKAPPERPDEIRATFVAPRSLIKEFRETVAGPNQRTFSGQVRKMIEESVQAARDEAAA